MHNDPTNGGSGPDVRLARERPKPGWKSANSSDLYQVDLWGEGFVKVNPKGRVEVRPEGAGRGCDLFELVQDLRRRGLSTPILFRFDQIVQTRVRQIQHGFAAAIDAAGYQGSYHLAYPVKIDTPYPYTTDGKVWWPNTNPWPDPWITLTAMGAGTTTLRLATNIYLAALREPFTVSRAVSAAAIFTNNRAILGVSAGWLKEEFDLMGIAMKDRGRRLDSQEPRDRQDSLRSHAGAGLARHRPSEWRGRKQRKLQTTRDQARLRRITLLAGLTIRRREYRALLDLRGRGRDPAHAHEVQ